MAAVPLFLQGFGVFFVGKEPPLTNVPIKSEHRARLAAIWQGFLQNVEIDSQFFDEMVTCGVFSEEERKYCHT